MKRREFITLLGGAAAWPMAAHAQQQPVRPLVRVLSPLSAASAGAWRMAKVALKLTIGDVRYVPSPDSCRAAKFTHSITSSAIASRPGGMITPSALAVLTLIVSSYLIGSCTGNSATFAPLRIRSTYDAPRLYKSAISDP